MDADRAAGCLMEIPPTIVSWVNGEPTLRDAVWQLMLNRFPEGDDDPSVEDMVDLAFRNLRVYYTTDAAKKQIDSIELAKERYLVTYRNRYMDDVIASSVPPDTIGEPSTREGGREGAGHELQCEGRRSVE